MWRDTADLPEELIFHVNYLGGDMPIFAINFSRPGSQVVGQYYNFLRLGREGYRRIQQDAQDVALHLADEIEDMGPFRMITRGTDLPLLSWSLQDGANFTLFELSDALRQLRLAGARVHAAREPRRHDDLPDRGAPRPSPGPRGPVPRQLPQVLDRFADEPDRRPDTTAPAGFSHA